MRISPLALALLVGCSGGTSEDETTDTGEVVDPFSQFINTTETATGTGAGKHSNTTEGASRRGGHR